VSTLARKQRTVEEAIGLTDKLALSSQNLRMPLTKPLQDALQNPDLLASTVQSDDPGALQQQESRLNALTVETAKISPAIAALAKQRVLLTLYKSHLVAWRTAIANQYRDAWKDMIIRLVALVAVITFLIGAVEVSRRLTSNYVHDPNGRRMMLAGQRVLFWLTLLLIVSITFAFDLSSFITFLGLVSAGIAVALQNVILAVVGYFLLVGKLRIRVGGRVEISGVSGEVVEIGLFQFQLRELARPGEQPTGRVVSFSNSFVFVSPATGLFKGTYGSKKTPAH
jgi:small-conductance mechanosensitive channel